MNNYKEELNNNQYKKGEFLKIPSSLENFINTSTTKGKNNSGQDCYFFNGYVELCKDDLVCDHCGEKMYVNSLNKIKIKHIPIGGIYSYVCIDKKQLQCSKCGATKMQKILFQAEKHYITKTLEIYTKDLLATNNFTNKEISYLTGIDRNAVKDIDKNRLLKLYTKNGEGKELFKPKEYAKYLGIDEFKLHDGHKYATHIINYDTGHILWIAKGKKKSVVYDFINHVGLDWMSHVEAVACDMNSDFEQAFKEKCPHLKIVYDYFHIVKNFNDKVINEIRKKEYKKLIDNKQYEEAELFKKSKYILVSNKSTLEKKDKRVEENKIIQKGSDLFKIPMITRKSDYLNRYEELIKSNELLCVADLVKTKLQLAFSRNDKMLMIEDLTDIVILCCGTKESHFKWFANLIITHYDGIITHAKIKISSGKIEGINNKIKTLRRQAYGYPDDEYFFLKLFDMTRN